MNIEEELKCKLCKEILNEPVSLNCCGENVCKKHIDEILSKQEKNEILCPLCESDIQNQKFHINKAMKSLIERELHKIKINPEYENVLKSFKEKINTIESMNSDPENYIYEEFAELKRKVHLDRETKIKEINDSIKEINDSTDDLLNQLESYEKKFREKSKLDNSCNTLIKNMKRELDDYEKCLKSLVNTDKNRKAKTEQVQRLAMDLDKEIELFKCKLLESKSFTYEPMKVEIRNILGKLMIKNLNLNAIYTIQHNIDLGETTNTLNSLYNDSDSDSYSNRLIHKQQNRPFKPLVNDLELYPEKPPSKNTPESKIGYFPIKK